MKTAFIEPSTKSQIPQEVVSVIRPHEGCGGGGWEASQRVSSAAGQPYSGDSRRIFMFCLQSCLRSGKGGGEVVVERTNSQNAETTDYLNSMLITHPFAPSGGWREGTGIQQPFDQVVFDSVQRSHIVWPARRIMRVNKRCKKSANEK